MARKKAPSNQGAVWTTKDFAGIQRLVKTGATGKTIAKKIGRSVVALYQKASIKGISLSARPTVRRSAVAKKARAVTVSTRRRSPSSCSCRWISPACSPGIGACHWHLAAGTDALEEAERHHRHAAPIPLRWFMPESPRWRASKGRIAEADAVVKLLEDSATRRGVVLAEPVVRPVDPRATARSDWRELFKGIYLKRTLMIWGLWVCAYMINNGLITWLPTLYTQMFQLPLQTSLGYGWITSSVGVIASIICALLIDKVGRKRWYATAFLRAMGPLLTLTWLGATSATEVLILATATYAILQTITFSLFLYSTEIYPTRLRAIGGGVGSAWLRAGSALGPILVGWIVGDLGLRYVFSAFAAVTLIGGLVTLLFAIETKGRVLEELSP